MRKFILYTMLLVSMPFTVSAALIAHYQLDGNSNDETGFYNGSPTDVTYTSDRFGNPNSAGLFNGSSSYIDTLPVSVIPSTITFAAWIFPTDSSGNGQLFGSISNASGGKDGYVGDFFGDVPSDTELVKFSYYKGNTRYPDESGSQRTPDGSVPLNEWTHVAFTLDDANIAKIYVNGISMYSGDLLTTADSHDRALMIGKAALSQSLSFGGSIDDVRIYDNALSITEIQQLASVPIPGAIWLFGSGLLGLIGFRKYTK